MFFSCRKHDETYYLTDNQKRYANFQKGSYWIYMNDSTLMEDSVYLIKTDGGFSGQQYDGDVISYQGIGCSSKSLVDTNLTIGIGVGALKNNKAHCSYSFDYCCDSTRTTWYVTTDFFETKYGDYFGRESAQLKWYQYFFLNGRNYTSVVEIRFLGYHPNLDSGTVFIAKDIGILKWQAQFKDSSSESWSLLRYHVVQ